MLEELQNRLAFLEKRLTVLEHEVASLKAARQDESNRALVMLPHYVSCDAPGMLIANGYDLDPNDIGGKWRWVGNDGPIQFVLPFGLGEKATARILLVAHQKVDLRFARVYVNDKPVGHSLVGEGADRLALIVPLEPSPQTIDIVLDRIKSISLKEINQGEDARPLAFKFFGMEIVAREATPETPRPLAAPEPPDPSIRFADMRLDERFAGSGDYRHLDISVFDTTLRGRHWDRIKFKFANFKGDSYLEFRGGANWPEIFRIWPGTEEDAFGKLFKISEPKATWVPRLADRGDLEMLEALFHNLDLIVRKVTEGIDAPRQEIELWRVEARALADRARTLLAAAADEARAPVAPPASPEPKPKPEAVDDSIRFERVSLDERLPQAGEYRHLDISIFDARLKHHHWERIKFKFANFHGRNFLEFRDLADRPRVFRVWPGTEEDAISKLVNIPEPRTAVVPEIRDATDLELLRALFENLDLIVRAVTTGIDASPEEIELWRAEARALADLALPALATP